MVITGQPWVGIFEYREIRGSVMEQLLRQRIRFDPNAAESDLRKSVHNGELGARCMREDGMLKAAFGIAAPEEVFAATLETEIQI